MAPKNFTCLAIKTDGLERRGFSVRRRNKNMVTPDNRRRGAGTWQICNPGNIFRLAPLGRQVFLGR